MSLFKTKSGKVRKSPIIAGGIFAGLVILGNVMPAQPEPVKADPVPVAEAEPAPKPQSQPVPMPAPEPKPAAKPDPAPAPVVSEPDPEAFLAALRFIDPRMIYKPDTAISRGKNVCLDLKQGKERETAADNARKRFSRPSAGLELTQAQAEQVAGAAERHLCR